MKKRTKVPFYIVAGPSLWQIEEHIKAFLAAGTKIEEHPVALNFYLARTQMGRATHQLRIRLYRILRPGDKGCPDIEIGKGQFVTHGHVDPPTGSGLDNRSTVYLLLNTASSTSTGKMLQAHSSNGPMIKHDRVLHPL